MIRIYRPPQPAVLGTLGGPAVAQLVNRLKNYPGQPLKSEHFSSDVYAHPDVKSALLTAQHGKCAFCEAKITHIAYGHIEHFRPKAGYKQRSRDALQRPGYYWLAYTWENLLLSCELCNSRYKGNLFPLLHPDRRATSADDSLDDEHPLFVNPASQDPTEFIRFKRHQPVAVRNNRSGRATIDALGLKRRPLNEHREAYLSLVRRLWESTVQLRLGPTTLKKENQVLKNEATLRAALDPAAEYSAMARDYLLSVNFV